MAVALGGQKVSVKEFRISRQFAPWQEVKGSFRSFNSKNLYNLIDGGAPEYIENGLVQGIFQRLTSPDSAILEIFFEDFGTSIQAKKMFAKKRQNRSEPCSFSDLDTTTLSCNTVIGGFAVFGFIDRFYFELVLMGVKGNEKAGKMIALAYKHFCMTAAQKK
jgi:hypothetical protein